jgi:hypothetical protein
MTEIFKDIEGFEGLYQISNLGNVKSLPKGDGNGNRERLLKFDLDRRNHTTYHRVTLSKNGKTQRFLVHRLVALAFIDNPHNKHYVNHIDNNGSNNYVTNLEWVTCSENMEHSSAQGRQDICRALAVDAMKKATIKNALARYDSMVGMKIGSLFIEDYTIDTSLKRRTPKFTCKCDCGNTTIKNRDQLNKPNPTCNECSRKIAAQKRKQGKDIVSTV